MQKYMYTRNTRNVCRIMQVEIQKYIGRYLPMYQGRYLGSQVNEQKNKTLTEAFDFLSTEPAKNGVSLKVQIDCNSFALTKVTRSVQCDQMLEIKQPNISKSCPKRNHSRFFYIVTFPNQPKQSTIRFGILLHPKNVAGISKNSPIWSRWRGMDDENPDSFLNCLPLPKRFFNLSVRNNESIGR